MDAVLATNRWNIKPLFAANSIALVQLCGSLSELLPLPCVASVHLDKGSVWTPVQVLLAAAPVHAFGPLSSEGDNLNNIPSQLSSTGTFCHDVIVSCPHATSCK